MSAAATALLLAGAAAAAFTIGWILHQLATEPMPDIHCASCTCGQDIIDLGESPPTELYDYEQDTAPNP